MIQCFESRNYDLRELLECEQLDPDPSHACASGFLSGVRMVGKGSPLRWMPSPHFLPEVGAPGS